MSFQRFILWEQKPTKFAFFNNFSGKMRLECILNDFARFKRAPNALYCFPVKEGKHELEKIILRHFLHQ